MLKKITRSPVTTAVLFVLAAGLLLTGTIGGVRAAPLTYSDDYIADMALTDIDIALVENGGIADGELLADLIDIDAGETFQVGKRYDEALAVQNIGTIDEYVRVYVYKYWTDVDGKAVDLDPDLIDLHLVTGSGWTIDTDASTAERTVLYYSTPLAAGEDGNGEISAPFADSLAVSSWVLRAVSELKDEAGYSYDYNDVQFHVKVVADGVQTHNADDARLSAWGVIG